MDDRGLETILARLLGAGRPEVSCEEGVEELDRYVGMELAGVDTEAAVPGLETHLEGCPACAEDHASLLALVRSEERQAAGGLR
jgi:hypothetical protein